MSVIPYVLAGGLALILGTRRKRSTDIVPMRINWMPDNQLNPTEMRVGNRYWFTVPIIGELDPSIVSTHPIDKLALEIKSHETGAGKFFEIRVKALQPGACAIKISNKQMHVEVKK